MSEPERTQVALGCRVLAAEGHNDFVWGHVSARDGADRGAWLKAAGWGLDEIDARRVHLVDPQGVVIEGGGRRHAEYPIHLEVLAARPDVGAVVHTHPRAAVAFGALETPLRPVSHEATLFVPPDVARFRLTGDLILTPELGRAVAAELGQRNAVLLVNHGIVAVGPDVRTAVMTAILLERACQTQLAAMAAGVLRRWSDDDEARAKRTHCYPPELIGQAWEYLVRRLADGDPPPPVAGPLSPARPQVR
jgi:L-fuculose-phosphate aldolase